MAELSFLGEPTL